MQITDISKFMAEGTQLVRACDNLINCHIIIDDCNEDSV